MKKKIAVAVSLLLVLALSVGGTIAWLTDKTDAVTNTFTVGKVDIELTEPAGAQINYAYAIVPGDAYAKDPTITVAKDSEKSYVFVTIAETNNTITVNGQSEPIVQWAIANGWSALDSTGAKVYYQVVEKPTNAISLQVLAGGAVGSNGQVTINENLTTENKPTNDPKLTITAAAIQFDNIDDVYEAWDNLPDDFKNDITVTKPVNS